MCVPARSAHSALSALTSGEKGHSFFFNVSLTVVTFLILSLNSVRTGDNMCVIPRVVPSIRESLAPGKCRRNSHLDTCLL